MVNYYGYLDEIFFVGGYSLIGGLHIVTYSGFYALHFFESILHS